MLFSLKREVKVYVVHNNIQYLLDISSIDFGQVFTEYSYSNKTIQVQNMFEQSIINKANPATFELTFPAIQESDLRILFNRAIDYYPFDLYIKTRQDVFKIEGCVISNSIFIIEKLKPLAMTVSGEGKRLTRWTQAIPGTPRARSNTMTYNAVNWVDIQLSGGASKESLSSVSIELSTDIEWVPYTTVNGALEAVDANSTMYPVSFTVNKRSLHGAFTLYQLEPLEWLINTSLFIRAGQKEGQAFYGFEFDMSNVSIQNNYNTNEVFTQTYTWRMTQNPDFLTQVIAYIGVTDVAGALLDSWHLGLLDYQSDPILESV